MQEFLKNKFREEKLKATEKHLTGRIDSQGGKKIPIPSSKLINEEFFIFGKESVEYFGTIKTKCDYFAIEKRDMEKPVRREELAISPRLAKIMINLSDRKSVV